MFFEKLQTEIIKGAVKRDCLEGKMLKFSYDFYENSIVIITSDSAYFIPKDNFYLNIDTVFKGNKPVSIKNLIQKSKSVTKNYEMTNNIKIMGKITLNVLKYGNEEVYLNSKIVDMFKQKYTTLIFKGTDYKSPVYVYYENSETLLGIIVPVLVQE